MKDIGKYEEVYCDFCIIGYVCDFVGLFVVVILCFLGYYCILGFNMIDFIGYIFGDFCFLGYFCLEGIGDY